MSSTNRGSQRVDHDKYYTPDWLVDEGIKIAKKHIPTYVAGQPAYLLEPCCGGGAIVKKLQEAYPESRIRYFDIAPDDDFECQQQDFLEYSRKDWHITISNPAYKEAQAIIEHAIELSSRGGYVIMLLRVNFFGGQKRSAWLEKNMPIEMHVTPRRPDFTGKGTDSTEYAWFVWKKGEHPKFTKTYILDTRTARYRG